MALTFTAQEARIISRAKTLLERTLRDPATPVFDSLATTRRYLCLRFAGLDREELHALFLDAGHALIAAELLCLGTLNQVPIFPRELARAALRHNAHAVIVAHNHPSGRPEPSAADRMATAGMRAALQAIDIRLLDHIVVAGQEIRSADVDGVL